MDVLEMEVLEMLEVEHFARAVRIRAHGREHQRSRQGSATILENIVIASLNSPRNAARV
jgi:hypothetical protein